MKADILFVCPECRGGLEPLMKEDGSGEDCKCRGCGATFSVSDGIPVFFVESILPPADEAVQSFYDARAEAYDQFLYLTFFTHHEDETEVREGMIDLLNLKEDSKVLEVAAGTGRDSKLIAKRLGASGELYVTDISLKMLERCVERLRDVVGPIVEFGLCNATSLPFPDNSFDALYSFGGLGEFSDIPGSLEEMARVVRPGGKVVVGDESMPPWLRGTEFARILITTNPQFEAPLPLEHLPVEARNVRLRFVIGGVFYLIDFEVGEGEPKGNFDYEIPGFRGGTYRTRHEGRLEGVTPEAKKLYVQAAEKSGKSLHRWLDEVVKAAAESELKNSGYDPKR